MSINVWREPPLVRAVENEVLMLVGAIPRFTAQAARETAREMIRMADELETLKVPLIYSEVTSEDSNR